MERRGGGMRAWWVGHGKNPLLGVEWIKKASVAAASLDTEGEELPDAVLVDGRAMGLEDQAMSALLSGSAARGVPVLLLVGPDDPDQSARALELGAEDVLRHPIHERELRVRLNRAVQRRVAREKLLAQAQTDQLTGIANFGALQQRLDDEFVRASRYGHGLAVVMLDLDHLKQINDRFGHGAGNGAILALCDTLKENLRQTDFAGRFGGDEFAVLLPYQNPEEASIFAERVRTGLRRLVPMDSDGGAPITLSLSAGVAAHAPGYEKHTAEALLAAADQALYAAKRAGRDRVVVFEHSGEQGHAGHH